MNSSPVSPKGLAAAFRAAFHAAVSKLRGMPVGRNFSRLLGRHFPALKGRLVRRYVVYDRTLQQAISEPDTDRRPLPPPAAPEELGAAERAIFTRLAWRGLQSELRG